MAKEHHELLVIYPPILQRAREMRHPLTPAEAKVWARVRDRQIGYKIRRQHPICHFIADFYCSAAKLLIEIDGDIHAEPDQEEYDAARTSWLEERGYHVIRFHNDDIHGNLDTVLQKIHSECEKHSPLPEGEGPGVRGNSDRGKTLRSI